jgi:hypothetical protein
MFEISRTGGKSMNIQTVAQNLRRTIAGKEQLLADLKGRRIPPEVSIHYLEININELKRVLQDVEQCLSQSEYSLDGPMIKMFRED